MKFFFSRIFPLLLIGLCAGFLNGLLGAGGGILIVLGMKRIFKAQAPESHSIFASAIAVMLPLSLISALRYLKSGHLQAQSTTLFLLPAVLGGALGALLLRRLSPASLFGLFSTVIALSGVFLLL